MDEQKNIAFDFGKNWRAFCDNALDEKRFASAFESLEQLIPAGRIKGSSFLDIGCGSGIFAIAASLAGARKVIGIDMSKESIETSTGNKQRFAAQNDVSFHHKSIFDPDVPQLGNFDIVYSWGALHHTGDMYRAIDIACGLVEPGSLFVVAIYNRHWSCGIWKIVKWLYNKVPGFAQRLMVWIFYVVIALAKFIVTRRNPFRKKRRGMSFYYDVIDWIGGYPYEYASKEQIIRYLGNKGFVCIKFVAAPVPTGCNEFVFEKKAVGDKNGH